MNDAPEARSELVQKPQRGQRLRVWAAEPSRLRTVLLSLLALGLIASAWTGIHLNADPASQTSPNPHSSTANAEGDHKAPSSQDPGSSEDDTTVEKPEPADPKPKPSDEETAGPKPAAGCEGFSGNQMTACRMLDDHGFAAGQMDCLTPLWDNESGWNHAASNPSSGAYGIPQALPGNKMSAAGSDWDSNPATQIEWGLGYIDQRYGDPCGAWSFWQSNNYY